MKPRAQNPTPTRSMKNQVIEGVAAILVQQGYGIKTKCSTVERGIYACAENIKTRRKIYVEGKGPTSSIESSSRFGKEFRKIIKSTCTDSMQGAY